MMKMIGGSLGQRAGWAALLMATALSTPLQAQANNTEHPAASPAPVEIRDAWIRLLPGKVPAGAYLTIVNHTSRPVFLIDAASPAYDMAMLHQTQMHAGTSRMVEVERIRIDPQGTLEFSATGYHIMLMTPKVALHVGEHTPITLRFEGAPAMTVPFEVRNADGSSAAHP